MAFEANRADLHLGERQVQTSCSLERSTSAIRLTKSVCLLPLSVSSCSELPIETSERQFVVR